MSHNELLFHTLDKSFKAKVSMGNGETVDAHGKGSVSFQTTQGIKFIHDVFIGLGIQSVRFDFSIFDLVKMSIKTKVK